MTATPMPRPVKPRIPSIAPGPHLVGANRLGRHASPSSGPGTSPETLDDVGVLAQIAKLPAGDLEDGGVAQPLLDPRPVARRERLHLLVAAPSR